MTAKPADQTETRGLSPLPAESREARADGPPSVMVEVLRREIAEQTRLKEAAEQAHRMIAEAERQTAEDTSRLRARLTEEEKEHVARAVAEAEIEAERIVAEATARAEEKRRTADAATADLIARGTRLILRPDETPGISEA